MRIAQVSHNLECGGSMAMVVALSSKLAELGHEVDVVCLDRPTGSAHERLSLNFLDQHRVPWRFLGRKLKYPGIITAVKLWWLIQSRNYDVVHSHLPMADAITGFVRRLTVSRFKHVLTVHSTNEPRPKGMAALGAGANVVYCSESVFRYNPVSGVSYTVIPNGIVQSPYLAHGPQDGRARRGLGLPDNAIVVILVGRMCSQKNYDAAIDAISIFKRRSAVNDVYFLFCGDGKENARLQARAMDLGVDCCVRFLGNRTDIPELLAASDVYLSTSLFEGMPLTVLEALTAGLPCVLSSIDEHYEIARNMPGCVFASPNSPEEIASALQVVTNGPIPASILKPAREPHLKQFTIDRCTNSYLRLYESLCHG